VKTGIRKHGGATLRVSWPQAIPASDRGRVREISAVKSAQRGQGDASALLDDVCQEADRSKVALLLTVEPDKDSSMTETQLMFFYARKGFEVIQSQPCVMVRA
jgi:GNAT superfamily N-acetyltransferase